MTDIRMDMSPLWCDRQVIHVADIRTDYSHCGVTDGRLIQLTYGRTRHIGGMTDKGVVHMFQMNHTCDATPPQVTLIEVLV